jgi:hypothetical protein
MEADAGESEEREMKLFPGREQQIDTVVTDHALTQDFFIFTTDVSVAQKALAFLFS